MGLLLHLITTAVYINALAVHCVQTAKPNSEQDQILSKYLFLQQNGGISICFDSISELNGEKISLM